MELNDALEHLESLCKSEGAICHDKALETIRAYIAEVQKPSHNTASLKLPQLSEVETKVKDMWAVCKDTDLGTLLTGAQLAYSFIERQLQA